MSSTIPSDWMWSPPTEFGVLSNDKAHCPKRQSICEIEGDTSVDGLSGFMPVLTLTNSIVDEHMHA